MFFYYDNLVILARLHVLPWSASLFDYKSYFFWFLADFTQLVKASISFLALAQQRRSISSSSSSSEDDLLSRKATWNLVKVS